MRRTLPLLLLLCCAPGASANAPAPAAVGEPAWPPPPPALERAFRSAPKDVGLTRFGPLPAARVEAAKRANAAPGAKRLTIGLERDVASEAQASDGTLTWVDSADGGLAAHWRIQADGAAALRSGLRLHGLPAGALLRFAGADGVVEDVVPGATAAALQAQAGLYWSPVTEGAEQRLELHLPAGADPRWVRLSLERVSHLFVSPRGDLSAAKIGESGSCNINARCVPSTTAGYDNAKRAVARMLLQGDGGSGVCTGTLLNDTDAGSQVPLLFGAAHCIADNASAASLSTFWFYESSACNVVDQPSGAVQVGGGSTLLFANEGSDVSLVRMNAAPPAGAYYSGWNSTVVDTGSTVQVLHHPRGDVLKFSQGVMRGLGASQSASGSFQKVSYSDGTTEPGSSGSALLTYNGTEFVVRGGLLGGTASCANDGDLNNPDNSDDFSRLDLDFASLRPFLMPTSTPPPSSIDYTGAWSNPQQSGWGLVVIRGASGVYGMYIYHYDQDSTPGWYLSAGALGGTAYNAGLLAFTGPWFGINPFNPAQVANRTAGNLSVNFTSATSATINFTIDGRTVSTTLTKLAF